MTSQNLRPVKIVPVPPHERVLALQLLLGDLAPGDRERRVTQILAETDADDFDGLLVAVHEAGLAGAIWARPQAGRIAQVWAPRLAVAEPESTLHELLAAADVFLAARHVRLAQALLPTDTGPDAERLRGSGFRHVADLLYLVSLRSSFPDAAPATCFEFESDEPYQSQRWAQIVEQTYQGTQDCPELNGVRNVRDVLAGYRAATGDGPGHWLIARHKPPGGEPLDVGCLLLAEHPEGRQWELLYMGLVPEARGRGWGTDLVRHAQWLAAQAGIDRLVLAVDARNAPALSAYAAAGFVAWDRRSIFLKLFEPGMPF